MTDNRKGFIYKVKKKRNITAKTVMGERFFDAHEKEMDLVLCIEILIFILIVIFSSFVEFFSKNEFLIRESLPTKIGLILSLVLLTLIEIIGLIGKNKHRPWFRYIVIFGIAAANIVLSSYMAFSNVFLILFPIFLATFYYDAIYVCVTSVLVLTARITGLVLYYKYFFAIDFWDLEMFDKYNAKNLTDISEIIFIIIIGVSCVILSIRLHKTMEEKLHKEQERTEIDRDMETAGKIQKRMLIRKFPVCREYEVKAYMMPARMVGGDFYDFIELSNDRVALIIADVSGKGLQASLFMSQVKALFKVYAQSENSTDKIAEKTNTYLTAAAGKERLFVTAWIGIVDLRTGMLTYTNAGHNPPCISRDGSPYELMDSKVNFVVGGKPLIKYSENQIKLKPGDRIFLYTDGVTEAKNAVGDFYTEKSLLNCLNGRIDTAPEETVEVIKNSLHEYTENTEQYDDVTMLAFMFKEYAKKQVKAGRTFPADTAHFDEALMYIRSECEKIGCSERINKDIELACSEIIANICLYAYVGKSGDFEISAEKFEHEVKITFTDHGIPFNPLLKATPDTTVSLADRKAGGMGIYIVKKLMNDVLYRYENNCNVLVLIKLFK